MYKNRKIYLTGIGPGSGRLLTAEAKRALEECDCIIGAKRLLEAAAEVAGAGKPVLDAYDPDRIRTFIEEHEEYQCIVVALSGDSGFYSGAKRLQDVLGEYEVISLPGISSVAYLAARLGISWEDAALVSVHGRRQNYIQVMASRPKTFVLLGGSSGEEFCQKIREYGLLSVEFTIGRNLSYENETVITRRGAQLTEADVAGLVTVLAENPAPDGTMGAAIPDGAWIRGEVPMTKEEVRTVSIGKLRLGKDSVLYDVGAGTGSVAIEAARRDPSVRVYAIERNPAAVELIRQNRRKFYADWVTVTEGDAPAALAPLEPPTHVFIGGSGGRLKEILTCVKEKNPDVRIVINAASLETMKEVTEAMEEGLLQEPEVVQLWTAKTRKLGGHHLMTGFNPICIVSHGGKEETT